MTEFDNFREYRGSLVRNDEGNIALVGTNIDSGRPTPGYVLVKFSPDGELRDWLEANIDKAMTVYFSRDRENTECTFSYSNNEGKTELKTFKDLETSIT